MWIARAADSTLLGLAISTILIGIDIRDANRPPERRAEGGPPPPLCDAQQLCTSGFISIYVDPFATAQIGLPKDGHGLQECAGSYSAVQYTSDARSKSAYTRLSSGPYACACLVECRRWVRDCAGDFHRLDGWTLMMPASTDAAFGCECAEARWPADVPGSCNGSQAPARGTEALIVAYAQTDPTCLTPSSPPELWRTFNFESQLWQNAAMTARCSSPQAERCMGCRKSCAGYASADCPFEWPPRCTDSNATCHYGCDTLPSITFDVSACA